MLAHFPRLSLVDVSCESSEDMEKTVFITGASRGLGYALVEKFLLEGWKVYCTVRTKFDAEKLSKKSTTNCFPIITDVTSESLKYDLTSIFSESTKVDVLINNAGAGSNWMAFEYTSISDVKNLLDVHCLGVMRVTQSLIPHLSENGLIINISSRFGSISKIDSGELDHIKCSYSYKIAKSAQNMFTLSLSKEFGNTSRRICSIHPGKLKTESASKDADKQPSEAAEELYSSMDNFENGRFYDLFEGVLNW